MARSLRRAPRAALAFALSVALAGQALSAPAPQSPAQALPEPAMRPAAGTRFALRAVTFSGNTRVPARDLEALADAFIGREVVLADLESIARRATALYRARGYLLAQAFVPVQEVENGTVTISIVEGTLGRVAIDVADDAPVSRVRVEETLGSLRTGEPLSGPDYERGMLLLSDLPGIRPRSAISTGAAAGTTDLDVQVTRGDRFAFVLETDNHGSPESGRIRAGGTVRWASPTGAGDNLDLRLLAAEGMHTAFGRLAYERPLGTRGVRAGIGLARVQYELGGAFRPLDATGTADIVDVSVSHALVRQRTTNVFLRASIDHKDLTDEFRAVGVQSDKEVRGVGLGVSLEHRDAWLGGGYTSANALLYLAELDLRDPFGEALDGSVFGRRTEGRFGKLTLQATRLQAIGARLSLFAGGGLQIASDNLDPSEQLSLGGPRAVRAYSTNEVLVDEGWIANVELRFAASERITPFLFYDAAHGAVDHDRSLFDPSPIGRSLRGYGLGIAWSQPGNWALNATLAWPDTRRALADPRDPRLYLQLQKQF
ncbi:MAG TPA: ShlB/FhaC/HecB family hemolysin secretion/activation protein [Luteimonas sp.]|nr:ShlB/FhaC/HecB family hemolysin secretion/activation protein [Luteimonas sp.]